MKTRLAAALLFAGVAALAAPTAQAEWSVSISFFHEELAPYGRWVDTRSYGEVWCPSRVATGWEPYVDGRWDYSDYGWTWLSDDPWSDIPYHYGTWVWIDGYGWSWIPGTVWAPAWVTWAYTDDYVGWAPVPPSFVVTATGYAGPAVAIAASRYVFVPSRQFVGVPVNTVRVSAAQNAVIFPRARRATTFTVANGYVHNVGLPPAQIERVVGRRLSPAGIPPQRIHAAPITTGTAGGVRSLRVVAPARERAAALRGSTTAGSSSAARAESAHRKAPEHSRAATAPRAEARQSAPVHTKHVEQNRTAQVHSAAPHKNPPSHKNTGKEHVAPPRHERAATVTQVHREPKPAAPQHVVEARPAQHVSQNHPAQHVAQNHPAQHIEQNRPPQPRAAAAAPAHPKKAPAGPPQEHGPEKEKRKE